MQRKQFRKSTARRSRRALGSSLVSNWKLFLYFVLLMMALHMSSHGTQDIYPTFLERVWHMAPRERAWVSSLSMGAGILGALSVGYVSDKIGRRAAMVSALAGCVCSVPLWAYSKTLGLLIAGAMLMQFFLQGAWGVVPAHLAEMSPDSIRGSLPGLGNQCGVLLASEIVYVELALSRGAHYAWAMACTTLVVFSLAGFLVLLGKERRAVSFG